LDFICASAWNFSETHVPPVEKSRRIQKIKIKNWKCPMTRNGYPPTKIDQLEPEKKSLEKDGKGNSF